MLPNAYSDIRWCSFLGLLPRYNACKHRVERSWHSYVLLGLLLLSYCYSTQGKLRFDIFDTNVYLYQFYCTFMAWINIFSILNNTIWNIRSVQKFNLLLFKINFLLSSNYKCKVSRISSSRWCFVLANAYFITVIIVNLVHHHVRYLDFELYVYFPNENINIYLLLQTTLVELTLIILFKEQLKKINELSLKDVNEMNANRLDVILLLYSTVFDAVALFNKIFGFQILTTIIQTVINVLRWTNKTISLTDVNYFDMFHTLLWVIVFMGEWLVLAWASEKLELESKRSTIVSTKLLDVHFITKEISEKVYLLCHQIHQRKVGISAAGFFKLNYSTLFVFLNLMSTYVVVIIQLNMAGFLQK